MSDPFVCAWLNVKLFVLSRTSSGKFVSKAEPGRFAPCGVVSTYSEPEYGHVVTVTLYCLFDPFCAVTVYVFGVVKSFVLPEGGLIVA
jgi:hypothetical protein